ncbi:YbjN domain-containing protein [Lyngbya aestuarii]|uniref:YbjN domain-containing protein n=1 Tax=Lyngbya aestuarii TaxID=118322 RepID=UPI00403E1B2C
MNTQKTQTRNFEAMVNFFKEDDWPFSQIDGQPVLSMGFEGENGQWICYAKTREQEEQFVFYSVTPFQVAENKRQNVAEFLTRVNYGLIIGNFELNFDNGEVRYKTSINIEENGLNSQLIDQLVYANIVTMDKYLPRLMSVIYADVTPSEAISQVER